MQTKPPPGLQDLSGADPAPVPPGTSIWADPPALLPLILGAISLITRSAPSRRSEHRSATLEHRVLGEIALDELDAGNRLHRQQVDRDDAAPPAAILARVLAPAARRRAEIDDRPAPGFSSRSFCSISIQLVDRARAPAVARALLHVRVMDVPLQPALPAALPPARFSIPPHTAFGPETPIARACDSGRATLRMLTLKHRAKVLRGLAHKLKPVVMVGHAGLSDNVLAEIDRARASRTDQGAHPRRRPRP